MARRRWAWLEITIVAAVLLALGGWWVSEVTDEIAASMLSSNIPPRDKEYPAVATIQTLSSMEFGALAGEAKGLNCSIPSPLEKLVFAQFGSPSEVYRQACVAHDLCYRHGAVTYGYSQTDCDLALVRAAFRLCRHPNEKDQTRCLNAARKVFAGVFAGGAKSYRAARLDKENPAPVSSVAEYEPYPAGVARYAVPRLLAAHDGTPARLVYFLQRPGGGQWTKRLWHGVQFGSRDIGDLPNRYNALVAPPWVVPGPSGDLLVWWRRSAGEMASTKGLFEVADLGERLEIVAAGKEIDPGSTQFYPVSGAGQGGPFHFIGMVEFPGEWPGCVTSAGMQTRGIAHVVVTPARDAETPASYTCDMHPFAQTGWVHIPPLAKLNGEAIDIQLFRRDSNGRTPFDRMLRSVSLRIPSRHAPDPREMQPVSAHCWNVPESAEPLMPLGGNQLSLASLSHPDDAGEDRNGEPEGELRLKLFSPDEGCNDDDPTREFAFTPDKSTLDISKFVRSRMIHLRHGEGGWTDPSKFTDLLLMTSVAHIEQENPDESQAVMMASLVLIWFGPNSAVRCDQIVLPPRTFRVRKPEALPGANDWVPLVGKLDSDGVPDLVLAQPQKGDFSLGYVGDPLPDGRLAFKTPEGLSKPSRDNACRPVRERPWYERWMDRLAALA